MDHMADAWNAMERAVHHIRVKTCRLVVRFDEPILRPSEDDDQHLQVGVVAAHSKRMRDDMGRFFRACRGEAQAALLPIALNLISTFLRYMTLSS
jgi:hypothetical protein